MIPNSFTDLLNYLSQLMTQHAGLFEQMGIRQFWWFAGIMMVIFWIKVMFAGFDMSKFLAMSLHITGGLALTRYYHSAPIPFFGVTISGLIMDQGQYLANQLSHSMVTNVLQRLSRAYMSLETPGIGSVLNGVAFLQWGLVALILILAAAAVLLVVSWGYIAAAMCILLGPVFIPFFIAPGLQWMFWGWLRCFVTYALYGVVANAYLFVFGSLLINFIDSASGDFSGPRIAVLFFPLLFVLIAFTWGVLRIPLFASELVSGRGGSSAVPGF